MKTKKLLFGFVLSAVLAAAPAVAQTETAAAAEEGERPEMPVLFFTKEQRRILEAVRQGVVETETFAADGFVPIVIEENLLPEVVEEVRRERTRGLQINAIIRNRTTGAGYILAENEVVNITEGGEVLDEFGLEADPEAAPIGDDYAFQGVDAFENSKFKVKVGQYITKDGYVDENLPVIVRRSRQ